MHAGYLLAIADVPTYGVSHEGAEQLAGDVELCVVVHTTFLSFVESPSNHSNLGS